jgi:hypothetical protein
MITESKKSRIGNLPDWMIGAGLALMSQTKYRFFGPIGAGELLCAISIGAVVLFNFSECISAKVRSKELQHSAIYIFGGLTLFTIVNYISFDPSEFGGLGFDERIRELTAFITCALLMLALGLKKMNFPVIGFIYVLTLVGILAFQFRFGGPQEWYAGARFSGGAANPNQTGLYLICAASLIRFVAPKILAFPLLAVIGFLGYWTKSDALYVSALVFVLCMITMAVLPRSKFYFAILSFMFLGILALALDLPSLLTELDDRWAKADEGGIRLTLHANGIRAWLASPFTILFGNGAGYFSGINAPFEASECHSTPIEILTIGGIFGLYFLFWPATRIFIDAFKRDERKIIVYFSALVVFSLFHFVSRHPCFWFCIFFAIDRLGSTSDFTDQHFGTEKNSDVYLAPVTGTSFVPYSVR